MTPSGSRSEINDRPELSEFQQRERRTIKAGILAGAPLGLGAAAWHFAGGPWGESLAVVGVLACGAVMLAYLEGYWPKRPVADQEKGH